jgi:hypothetical protein
LGLDGPVTPLKIGTCSAIDGRDSQKLSAPSERLFSASGNVVTKLRSSLDSQNLEMIVFLHENMKKVKMTYDCNILPNPAAGQPTYQVVNID